MDGYETAKAIAEKYPDINVLILTMYDSELLLIRLLQVGIKGFLKKDIHPYELKKALLQVAEDHYYYSFTSLDKLTHLIKKGENGDLKKHGMLTENEVWFLQLSSSDLTYKEIATQMEMSPKRIDHLRDVLFEKLEIKTRVGLAIYAIRNGLVSF
jgi:DNA-binding NarL/FixJ family response regulator